MRNDRDLTPLRKAWHLPGRFTFDREAKWMVVLSVLLPLLALLLGVVIPAFLRR